MHNPKDCDSVDETHDNQHTYVTTATHTHYICTDMCNYNRCQQLKSYHTREEGPTTPGREVIPHQEEGVPNPFRMKLGLILKARHVR